MDLQPGREGGTWLAMTTTGRISALTNYRIPVADVRPDTCGRGQLITDYLKSTESPSVVMNNVDKRRNDFAGFNLLCADVKEDDTEFVYYTNAEPLGIPTLPPGTYSMCNKVLDSPWPKQLRGKQQFNQILNKYRGQQKGADARQRLEDELLRLMGDETRYDETTGLPHTGVPLSIEIDLSAIFCQVNMNDKRYGTRSTSLIFIDDHNEVTWVEYARPDVGNEAPASAAADGVPPQIAQQWIRTEQRFPLAHRCNSSVDGQIKT
ncbi:hypothetical protein, variant [Sphaeroforma arctica JP610]|uniref:Transport and Golgi organization protein 2 n=1 Tax=Sphaeroforma arctica JP610 TaxID=667725 RepID=A0A0L0FN00_9EUKA|nr:hypothetical protein, variant [Sphaeroforma arctica JP610]KNC77881.1 hypothetical protein, variant [Sphaeroforma arctica JP610]|eukprot:XP_014151783.1 hypothetical protein, variant [Sphaeroforma arctica JP610]